MARRVNGDIHLVLTDVAMPGMNGAQMVSQFARVRPSTRVIYMSGDSETTACARGTPDALLEKPFSTDTLLRAVRHALDATDALTAGGERALFRCERLKRGHEISYGQGSM